jgi:hypothetical protein
MRMPIIAEMILLSVAVILPPASAAPPQMNDFAYGLRLVTPATASLVKIDLPENVYRELRRDDRTDIRVFTVNGRLVPHFQRRLLPGGGGSRTLFFETQAGQAYVLAYGSHTVPAPTPPSALVQRIDREGPRALAVRVGPRIELGGAGRPKQTAGASSGRLLSLSTLLLGCVLLLAFLAWWAARRQLR